MSNVNCHIEKELKKIPTFSFKTESLYGKVNAVAVINNAYLKLTTYF